MRAEGHETFVMLNMEREHYVREKGRGRERYFDLLKLLFSIPDLACMPPPPSKFDVPAPNYASFEPELCTVL